jgi:hypothetical protein
MYDHVHLPHGFLATSISVSLLVPSSLLLLQFLCLASLTIRID